MRNLKASVLLGAFLSVAGLISQPHTSFGTTLSTTPVTVPLEFSGGGFFHLNPLALTPSVNVAAGQLISLSFQNIRDIATGFVNLFTSTAPGSLPVCGQNGGINSTSNGIVVLFTSCSLNAGTTYYVGQDSWGVYQPLNVRLSLNLSISTSNAVVSYSSNVNGDTTAQAVVANIEPQFSLQVPSVSAYQINPTSLSTFTNNNQNYAQNSVVGYNKVYNNNNNFTYSLSAVELDFSLNGLPQSVSLVVLKDSYGSYLQGYPSYIGSIGSINFYVVDEYPGSLTTQSETFYFNIDNSGPIAPANINITAWPYSDPNLKYLNNVPFVTFSTSSVSSTSTSATSLSNISFTAFLPNVQANTAIGLGGWIKIYTTASGTVGIGLQGSASSGSYCEIDTLNSGSALYVNIANLLKECGLSKSQAQSGVPIELDFSGINPNQVFVYAYGGAANNFKRVPLVQSLNQSITSFSGYLANIQGNPGVVDGWIKIYSTAAGTVTLSIPGGNSSCTSISLTPNQAVYIQNSQLLSICGLTPTQAQSGVPIELQFSGVSPDQVSVYAYQGSGEVIKRVPFTIPSANSINTLPSY